jgi:hypothetical protein
MWTEPAVRRLITDGKPQQGPGSVTRNNRTDCLNSQSDKMRLSASKNDNLVAVCTAASPRAASAQFAALPVIVLPYAPLQP